MKSLFDSQDVCAGKHGGAETSRDAFRRLQTHLGPARAEVLQVIAEKGRVGATAKEAAAIIGKPLHAISGRVTELIAMGRLYKTQERRGGGAVCRAFAEGHE